MNQKQYIDLMNEQLNELTFKLDQLKYQVVKVSLRDEYDSLISQMEQIILKIRDQKIMIEQSENGRWDELSKTIRLEVENFNNANRKARALFKPRED